MQKQTHSAEETDSIGLGELIAGIRNHLSETMSMSDAGVLHVGCTIGLPGFG
jgi:hypothetical protein